MITYLTQQQAIQRMNALGAENIPFLFVISYNLEKNIVLPLSGVQQEDILFTIKDRHNNPDIQVPQEPLNFSAFPPSFASYEQKFRTVKAAIQAGDSYLTNLTVETPLQTNYTLEEIYCVSSAPYKLLLQNHCTVFSPETFVTIKNGDISTCPMKGTIDAAIPHAEQIILADEKETAEQYTIVDLMRNDLNLIADNVHVEKFRYVEEIESRGRSLLQVSSRISGTLPEEYPRSIGSLMFTLLPAGSITGAPKKRTLEIINEVEGYQRGFYTGVFGCFANGSLDSAVMIRFIEQTENGYVFKSGGGITSLSEAKKEYQEMIDKVYVPVT